MNRLDDLRLLEEATVNQLRWGESEAIAKMFLLFLGRVATEPEVLDAENAGL